MLKKLLKFIRFCFIGIAWSLLFWYLAFRIMDFIWQFNLFNPGHWKKIALFWDRGGTINTFSEWMFFIALFALLPLWIWGWRKANKVQLAKVIFFPVFWYHDYQEKKYAQAPQTITLKNMGAKVGKKNSLEDMIAERMPKEKDKKDLNSNKIRSSFEDKNRSFHEKSDGQP